MISTMVPVINCLQKYNWGPKSFPVQVANSERYRIGMTVRVWWAPDSRSWYAGRSGDGKVYSPNTRARAGEARARPGGRGSQTWSAKIGKCGHVCLSVGHAHVTIALRPITHTGAFMTSHSLWCHNLPYLEENVPKKVTSQYLNCEPPYSKIVKCIYRRLIARPIDR